MFCHIPCCVRTGAVADSLVFDDVFVLEGFEDLDFPLEVPEVLRRGVLQLLHRDHLARAVLQGVVPAHLHAAEVPLGREREERTTLACYMRTGTHTGKALVHFWGSNVLPIQVPSVGGATET